MSKDWFTYDGTYGSTDDLLILDTANWTAEDWQDIADCGDAERWSLAISITKQRNNTEGK